MSSLIVSPALAFILDLIRRKLHVSRRWVFVFIALFTIPPILIWLAGYDFSNSSLYWYSITIIITSIFWGVYSFFPDKFLLKVIISILVTLPLMGIAFLGAMGSEWAGSREVLNRTDFKNYIALELGPQLYEKENILRVKKTKLNGFVVETVFETELKDSSVAGECAYSINDDETHLVYNRCNKTFSLR